MWPIVTPKLPRKFSMVLAIEFGLCTHFGEVVFYGLVTTFGKTLGVICLSFSDLTVAFCFVCITGFLNFEYDYFFLKTIYSLGLSSVRCYISPLGCAYFEKTELFLACFLRFCSDDSLSLSFPLLD